VTARIDVRDLLSLHTWTVFDVDPDGRVLAGWDGPGSVQLVEIGTDGGRRLLTDLPGACSGRYVVGDRAVVVEHDADGDERAQLSLLRLEPEPNRPASLADLEPLVRDPEAIHTLVDLLPGHVVYSTNRRNRVDFDVVVRELSSGAERTVYDGGGYVAEATASADRCAVTLFSQQPCSTQVLLSDDDGTREVTPADEHALHQQVHLLDDGSLVLSSNSGREMAAVVRLTVDGTRTSLVESDEHDLHPVVAPDGRTMLVAAGVDGGHEIALHGIDGGSRRPVSLDARGVCTAVWSADSRWLAIGLVSPTRPGDVLLLDAASAHLRTLVDGTEQLAPVVADALVEPSSHRIPARDGESIPCFVYSPASPAASASGSVVVNVHGGPEAQARRVFNPVVQALVAAGHIVLVPNVRGSTGYGKRWYSLDDVRLRLESVADLADLRAWVPAVGGDPERVALYGGSYGGYMVLAGLSMQPELWAAGVDVVGMSSLVTFLENTSAYRRASREREYGRLDEDRDFLEEASPLAHLDAMVAPLFVIHGANDPRVPLTESEQIKAALDAKGVPCTLLVYPDEGHGLAKRRNRLDAYPQVIEFLQEQLRR